MKESTRGPALAPFAARAMARLRIELATYSPFELVALLTTIYLLHQVPNPWFLELSALILGIVGLVIRPARLSPWFWGLVTVIAAARVVHDRWSIDNHLYLFVYWCCALTVAAALRQTGAGLARNARLLIGLAFFFAVLWKAFLVPDFRTGDFFRATFLTDHRFREVVRVAGRVSAPDERSNRRLVKAMRDGEIDHVDLIETPQLRVAAKVTSLWSLALETLVALSFLAPLTWRFTRWRHALLMLFVWTTYPIAPVLGFGWLLIILGLAQCPSASRTQLAYLSSFLAMLAFQHVPWSDWAASLIGG